LRTPILRGRLLALSAVVLIDACLAPRAQACTIQVNKGTPPAELAYLAEVTRAEAEKAARDRLKVDSHALIVSGELEAEQGCLIWSFDLRMPGERGIAEVHVDAGDGHVLSVRRESPQHDNAERTGRL
jgi:hypothetical protein